MFLFLLCSRPVWQRTSSQIAYYQIKYINWGKMSFQKGRKNKRKTLLRDTKEQNHGQRILKQGS